MINLEEQCYCKWPNNVSVMSGGTVTIEIQGKTKNCSKSICTLYWSVSEYGVCIG